ncbi:MAG TPA: alpha/beta family hydrolase [Blastocatellia bacterium]|nr:alpha/beta family hydrolase [Blastocatellia bacterium]
MKDAFSIRVDQERSVTGVAYVASGRERQRATLLLGHGAGAGQSSEFMVSFAEGLAARGVDVVTYNFLYTEQGRRAPDRGDKLEACLRAAIDAARGRKPLAANRLFIGGKSLGGRIASQAARGVDDLSGLVFLGYPLHPPGKPDRLRADHLPAVRKPMLFVQGSRDPFGGPDELLPIASALEPPADLYVVEGGDHSFKVPKGARLSQDEVFARAQDAIARWLKEVPGAGRP